MSRKNDMDLDAILREFHAEERRAAARSAAETDRPQPAVRMTVPPQPVVQTAQTVLETAPAQAPVSPARKTDTADFEQLEPPVYTRAARMRHAGIVRMIAVLAVLALLLGGLLFWAIRDEKQAKAEEPTQIRMDLGEALENYLDEAPTRTHG